MIKLSWFRRPLGAIWESIKEWWWIPALFLLIGGLILGVVVGMSNYVNTDCITAKDLVKVIATYNDKHAMDEALNLVGSECD